MKTLPKVFLIVPLMVIMGWVNTLGSNFMTINSTSMGPGQNFTVSVEIDNSDQFVAFQFDLPIPAGFSFIPGTAALNPARISEHLLDISIIPGNKLRVLGYSNTNMA